MQWAMEWQGKFCDADSKSWREVDAKDLEKPKNEVDGEFWMPISDFREIFAELDVSFLPANWPCLGRFHGEWSMENGTAGGWRAIV